jgi:hypothetical protein
VLKQRIYETKYFIIEIKSTTGISVVEQKQAVKVLTQVSDIFGKANFGLSEYEKENNLGLIV